MALRLFLQSLTRERHHARHFQDDYTIDEEPIQARPHRRLTKELHPLAPAHFAELNRLHFQYYLIRMVIKHHYLAPIDQPKGILDVGCGHGPWAQEVARTFPAAKVFGVDILPPPVVKTALFPPKNYRFLQGDIREDLPFPDQTFDFVHQQFLLLSIQIDQWAHIFQELLRVTRPGGWIEIVDSDLFIHHAGPATQCMLEWHIKIYSYYGIDPRKYLYLESYLGQEKLVNLQTHMVKVPIGQWGGRIGKLALADFLALTTEFQPLVTTILAISAEEYDQTAQAMQREWEANGCFFTIGVTYGQQPFAE